jgi:hypothetical protein
MTIRKCRNRLAVLSKELRAVSSWLASINELAEDVEGSLRGKDRSCTMWSLVDPGLGTNPSGDVQKGSLMSSSGLGEKGGGEY